MTFASPFNNPFIIKKAVAVEESNVKSFVPPREETAPETKEAAIVEEVAKKAAQPAAEAETPAEETAQPVAEAEAPAEEAVAEAEEKPKRKTRTKAETAEEAVPDVIAVKYGAGKITLDEIAAKFVAIENDAKWTEFEADMRKRIDEIKIKSDINLGSARILLEQVTDTSILLNRYKAEISGMERLFLDRTVGLIPRFKDINSIGKNEVERKRNVAMALEAFPLGGRTKVNIADITLAITQRKEIIDEFYANLEAKKNALYSYLSIIKAENKIFE